MSGPVAKESRVTQIDHVSFVYTCISGGIMRLQGKVALITGAAHGMGETEANMFAREGAKIVVADVLEAEGKQVVEAIAKAGGEACFVRLDVTQEEAWQK